MESYTVEREPAVQHISQAELEDELRTMTARIRKLEDCIDQNGVLLSIIRSSNYLPSYEEVEQRLERWYESKSDADLDFFWQNEVHYQIMLKYYDFFMAGQHASAGKEIKDAATKTNMHMRLWIIGIRSNVELLRQRLPVWKEYLDTFLNMSWGTISTLYEHDTRGAAFWAECLGDLARYRWAAEEACSNLKESWKDVAMSWYSRAGAMEPGCGRVLHRMAALMADKPLCQVQHYIRSLTVTQPFLESQISVAEVLNDLKTLHEGRKASLAVRCFLLLQRGIFANTIEELIRFDSIQYQAVLSKLLRHESENWTEEGAHTAICLIGNLIKSGSLEKVFAAYNNKHQTSEKWQDRPSPLSIEGPCLSEIVEADCAHIWNIVWDIFGLVLSHSDKAKIMPFLVIMLSFVDSLSQLEKGSSILKSSSVTWSLLADQVNKWLRQVEKSNSSEEADIPRSQDGRYEILPEDLCMRGQLWAERIYPSEVFKSYSAQHEELAWDDEEMIVKRKSRIIWLCTRIARNKCGLKFDNSFSVKL